MLLGKASRRYNEIKEVVQNEENAREVKEALVEIDPSAMALNLYEVETLWESFSDSRLAHWLIVSEESINDFIEWLE